MNRFGTFFCFLAYGFSSFLGLSADCFGSFLSFVSYGFSGLFSFLSNSLGDFFGFFARGFKSVLDRLSRFFCSVLYVFYCAFLARSATSAVATTKVIIRLVIFMTASFSFAVPLQRKRMQRAGACIVAASTRRRHPEKSGCMLATRTFVNRREFRQWDAEDIKRCDQSVSQSQTHRSNGFIAPRTHQDPFLAAYHATAPPKQAKKFHVFH